MLAISVFIKTTFFRITPPTNDPYRWIVESVRYENSDLHMGYFMGVYTKSTTSLLWIRDTVSNENGGEIVSAALLDPKNSVSLPAHIRMNLLILLSITNHIKLPTVLSQSFSTCNLFLAYQQLLFGKERFIICVIQI